MTAEDDTVEDVGRDADEEDDGVEVADEDVLYGGESLKGDDVVGVVPRKIAIHVTVDLGVSAVCSISHCGCDFHSLIGRSVLIGTGVLTHEYNNHTQFTTLT